MFDVDRSAAGVISAARRRSCPTRSQGFVPARIAAAAEDRRTAGARSDSRVVRPAVACAECVQVQSDHRHGEGVLPSVLDLRRESRRAMDRRGGRLLLRPPNNKQVRKVRWRPASGSLSHVFDDELVCASMGVEADKLRRIEPFPTDTLVPYDPGYLAGWTVERYQIDLVAAAERSRGADDGAAAGAVRAQVPGDTHRNLVVNAKFSGQTFKHILAPVWLMTYVYRAKSYQVVVNGVTGLIAGSRPWSWIKVTLLVLLLLIVFLVFAYYGE